MIKEKGAYAISDTNNLILFLEKINNGEADVDHMEKQMSINDLLCEDEFLLEDFIKDESSTEKAVIFMLRARGFLIDEKEGHYYISDNACVEDVEYLEKVSAEYNIGKIKKSENPYYRVTRKSWSETSGTYSYNSIVPKTMELIINKDTDSRDCKKLFTDRGQIGFQVCYCALLWAQFSHEIYDRKVGAGEIESYVAYYVKAVSACGVYTYFSCDGNHKGGGSICVYADYPSQIWHEYLWEYVVCKEFGKIPFIGGRDGIRFLSPDEQKKIYMKVYEIADFLYTNRKHIIELKKRTLETVHSRKYRRNHSKEEIEQQYRDDCKRVLSESMVF